MSTSEIPKIPDTAVGLIEEIDDAKAQRSIDLVGKPDSARRGSDFLNDLHKLKQLQVAEQKPLLPGPSAEDYDALKSAPGNGSKEQNIGAIAVEEHQTPKAA